MSSRNTFSLTGVGTEGKGAVGEARKEAFRRLGARSTQVGHGPIEETAEEKMQIKSLQIKHDDRYDAMAHYRQHGGSNASTGHFAKICKVNRRMYALKEDLAEAGNDDTFEDIADREVEHAEENFERAPRQPPATVTDRIEWQESFDRSVKRLFQDFELTDTPSCRLNHLDRMHAWFTDHGAKQVRKVVQGPSYLTADRRGVMPPGSTRNIPSKLSATTQILSSAYHTNPNAFKSPLPG